MRLQDKVTIITGAASGIGRSIARKFTAEGAKIIIADVAEERLAKVHAEVGGEMMLCNVTDKAQIDALVQKAIDTHGRIDVLCNNAGILDNLTPATDTADELWDKVIAVNMTGPFQLARSVLKHMVEAGSGSIVNTTSAAGLNGGRGGCSYTASKHGLVGLTRSIAWFYGPKGIRCNAVAPGAIQTRMASTLVPHMGGFERYQDYFGTIPPHGKAIQVADVVAFLASDEAAYVNGAVMPVDGGWSTF
jgi:NAD(P)-dependent dehydrogenase (short-subunit alcohol dehydrogenase family)